MKKMMQDIVALVALVGIGESMAPKWMSSSVNFRYGQQFTDPNSPDKFAKRIYSFTYVDGYRYGSNFFNLDVFLSDSHDPRRGIDHGDSEVYAIYRHQLYAPRVFNRPLSIGLVKGYIFTLGFDASRNNNLASTKKYTLMLGSTLKFSGPGMLSLSLLYYREKNHSGVPGVCYLGHTFNTAYMLNLAWMRPFKVGNHAAKFQGFVNYTGGKDKGCNDRDTTAETLVRTTLIVVALPGDKRQPDLWLSVGYEYRHNKFGVDGGIGGRTSTPTLNMEFTFRGDAPSSYAMPPALGWGG